MSVICHSVLFILFSIKCPKLCLYLSRLQPDNDTKQIQGQDLLNIIVSPYLSKMKLLAKLLVVMQCHLKISWSDGFEFPSCRLVTIIYLGQFEVTFMLNSMCGSAGLGNALSSSGSTIKSSALQSLGGLSLDMTP